MTNLQDFHRLGLKLKFAYSIAGLVLGLACILSGSILGLYGVTGHTTMAASALGLSTQVNDAAPGVIVFVVGVFVVFFTRFTVSTKEVAPEAAPKPNNGSGAPGGGSTFIRYSIRPDSDRQSRDF